MLLRERERELDDIWSNYSKVFYWDYWASKDYIQVQYQEAYDANTVGPPLGPGHLTEQIHTLFAEQTILSDGSVRAIDISDRTFTILIPV